MQTASLKLPVELLVRHVGASDAGVKRFSDIKKPPIEV